MENENTQLVDTRKIQEARMLSGQGLMTGRAYIPVIRINNKTEEKEVEIEGVKQLVEIPAKKGFLIKTKNSEGEFIEEFLSEELKGVVLKEAYEIRSKHKVEPAYYSFEFDGWNNPIDVFSGTSKECIFTGTYKQVRDNFSIEELNSVGKAKTSFDLFLILYLNIEGDVRRFRVKMNTYNPWFDYKASFGDNDTYVAYETIFNLIQHEAGTNKFYGVAYEKGDKVNLDEQLPLQKEIQKYFFTQTAQQYEKPREVQVADYEVIDKKEDEDEEEVSILDIPF